MKSRYLKIIQESFASNTDSLELNGDVLLVEELPREEVKTQSGIVLSGSVKNREGFDQNRPTYVVVLATGKGYYDEVSGAEIPLDVKPGDVILVSGVTTNWLSHFGPIISTEGSRIGLAQAQHWHVKFNGQEGYDKLYQAIQGKMESK